jgi:transposase, IS30 family
MPGRRLDFEERCEIKRGLSRGLSCAQIAVGLGRPTSTVTREVGRNGARRGYHAWHAQARAKRLRRRPKVFRLERHRRLARWVQGRLRAKWSPEQIAQRLCKDHPDDPRWWVSAETIYRSLFVQGRGGLREELRVHLRARKQRRRDPGDGRGQLVDMVLISERPAEAADRAVPGHWEGDLILGADGKSALGTLVERSSRYVLLFALRDEHTAATTRAALTKAITTLPNELRRSLTWDQGKELAEHARFTVDTGIQVYFCDPGKPWQRGTNENTNLLLRQYFPKGTRFTNIADKELRHVARELNSRPRKTLQWDTPAEVYDRFVAMTA